VPTCMIYGLPVLTKDDTRLMAFSPDPASERHHAVDPV